MADKTKNNIWYQIREELGDKVFKTLSEAGGVKVGTGNCSFIVPNGVGDGESRVAVINDRGNFIYKYGYGNPLQFFTSVQGDNINIYSYDCGNEIAKTLSGRYGVYFYETFVIFDKWD